MYRDMRGVMVKTPYAADPHMTLPDAALYMLECKIRHLPLVEDKAVVGIVSQRDILAKKTDENFAKMTLDDIAMKKPFVVAETESLSTTAGVMAHSKLGSALIVNEDSELVGIFTTTDALYLIQDLFSREPSFAVKPGNVVYLKDVVGWT